jgi:hypothetical protein
VNRKFRCAVRLHCAHEPPHTDCARLLPARCDPGRVLGRH